jgi:hypothetical protein
MAPMTREKYNKFKMEDLRRFLKNEKRQKLTTPEYNRKALAIRKAMSLHLDESEVDQWITSQTPVADTNANTTASTSASANSTGDDGGDSHGEVESDDNDKDYNQNYDDFHKTAHDENQGNDEASNKPPLPHHLKRAIKDAVTAWLMREQALLARGVVSGSEEYMSDPLYQEMNDLQAEAIAINYEEFQMFRFGRVAEIGEDLLEEARVRTEDDTETTIYRSTGATLEEHLGMTADTNHATNDDADHAFSTESAGEL